MTRVILGIIKLQERAEKENGHLQRGASRILIDHILELEKGIEQFIDWAIGPDSTIKDIPDEIWIPFEELLEEK